MGLLYPASIRTVWRFQTSLPGHVNKKLSPQHCHQTSCTGGPFVLCFASLFSATDGWLAGVMEELVWEGRRGRREWMVGHKNSTRTWYWYHTDLDSRKVSNPPINLPLCLPFFVCSNSIPPLYNQSCHSLAFPILSAPAAYTHTHTDATHAHIAQTQGAP